MNPQPDAPPPAETLPPGLAEHPDYEIKRELGRGGMGVVYLAHNKLMGRDEVLKVMGRQIMERPGVLERFLREIRAVAKLRHANIVTAYHAKRIGESIVFAMEHVDGVDLSEVVKSRGPLPVGSACNFIYQAALGLQHAHEEGLVHRDIKPSNLMLAPKGDKFTIKVLDFGLAKATREQKMDGALTHEGQALGTPDFIAPEQIVDAQSADIRADIYSLGATMYYLLSGRPPFQAKSLYEIYQAHLSRDADPLNLVRPEVPAELAALISKMMAKEPDRRFQTPGEVAQALKPFFKSAGPVPGGSQPGNPRPGQPSGKQGAPGRVPPSQAAPAARPAPAPPRPAKPIPKPTPVEPKWESLIDLREPDAPLNAARERTAAPASVAAVGEQARRAWSNAMERLRWYSPRARWIAAGLLAVSLALAFATAVLVAKSHEGFIVLAGVPDQSEVFVDGKRVRVELPKDGGATVIPIGAGRHEVQVKKAGFEASVQSVDVKTGVRTGMKVSLEPTTKNHSKASR